MERAEAFSRSTGGRVRPLQIDTADPRALGDALANAQVLVACAGRDDVDLARACLERGVRYVNVSASYPFLPEVERLHALARERGATAVPSVGLAPGLTNLLARRCRDALGGVRSLDLSVLLGMEEAHGEAAVRWTIENLDRRFPAPGPNGPQDFNSLTDPKATVFPGPYGRRIAYRFDFADQHVVSRTLEIGDVAPRICLDPPLATRLVALLKRTGAFRTLARPGTQDALVSLLNCLHVGADGFAATADAMGRNGRCHSCSVGGRRERRATGIVAALVPEDLCAASSAPVVFHIEQIVEPIAFLRRLANHGFSVCA
ncbi:MAG: hypothetical protein AVDCRST_MAG19-3622 [uncultured Thermomicrobiales bacterium]|uniref:Saccharopine dehydrogenase NADP binding domain-containing protein n=1 Tax=uncultured Thermomicrobiales bacterium TaxID=1645740 RepID=A0A6J4VH09_9BACT|nr:MAG: hypothetical protein AVDCRST_MAG19-3622 [uncultured Thermomicrobiales bacterium]